MAGEAWRWQLRDAEGRWVKMGDEVKWVNRGKWQRGIIIGSPKPDTVEVALKPGGKTKIIPVRHILLDPEVFGAEAAEKSSA
jgi:hypothetical protein